MKLQINTNKFEVYIVGIGVYSNFWRLLVRDVQKLAIRLLKIALGIECKYYSDNNSSKKIYKSLTDNEFDGKIS